MARFEPKRRITLWRLFVWEANHVRVNEFWMDEPDVTNAQSRAFVKATGYATTAEKPVDAEVMLNQSPSGTPRPAP